MASRKTKSLDLVRNARLSVISIAFWILFMHGVGIFIFTKGFLLTRPVLPNIATQPCTAQAPFKRAVVLIVDALRYDFVAPSDDSTSLYLNKFVLPTTDESQGFLVKFIADPPTTTLQRLKGLTTGSLPTFIDAGSNFAGTKVEEDNWVSQAAKSGNIAFVGDDTWEALYASEFAESHPFPSLNVRDLDTVDNGVKQWIPTLLQNSSYSVVIGHMLGVDHVGHRFGPNHPMMASKLQETADFVGQVASSLDDDTVMFVFGDHGMDSTGNHGGDSQDELTAALWMYTKRKGAFSREGDKTVAQIDFVPTISGLLGLPIPFNSVGFPIRKAFGSRSLWSELETETAKSISRYAAVLGEGYPLMVDDSMTPREYQQLILQNLNDSWVNFDMQKIYLGLLQLGLSVLVLILFYNGGSIDLLGGLSPAMSIGSIVGTLLGALCFGYRHPYALAVGGLGCVSVTLVYLLWGARFSISKSELYSSRWSFLAVGILCLEAATSFSNSFVIWEPRILHFLLVTLVVAIGARSLRGDPIVAHLGPHYCGVILVLLRVSSAWTVCREENGTKCRTTIFEPGSTLSPTWTTFAVSLTVLVLPQFLKRFWVIGGNYHKTASLIINMTPLMLLLSIAYWTIDNADARGYLVNIPGVLTLKLTLSRFALLSSIFGLVVWWKGEPSIQFALDSDSKRPRIHGYNNVYGSDALLPVVIFTWAIAAVNKPPSILNMLCLLYISFCVLDLVDLTETKHSLLVPVIFEGLGHLFFYWTGHQATIPSVQWDTAFVATSTVSYWWSPVTVGLNTLGPYFIAVLFSILSSTWRRPAFKDPRLLLGHLIRAGAGISLVSCLRTLANMVAAALLRRHLMAWKIFAPRFMLAGIVLLSVDLALLVAIGLGSHTVIKVTRLFG